MLWTTFLCVLFWVFHFYNCSVFVFWGISCLFVFTLQRLDKHILFLIPHFGYAPNSCFAGLSENVLTIVKRKKNTCFFDCMNSRSKSLRRWWRRSFYRSTALLRIPNFRYRHWKYSRPSCTGQVHLYRVLLGHSTNTVVKWVQIHFYLLGNLVLSVFLFTFLT